MHCAQHSSHTRCIGSPRARREWRCAAAIPSQSPALNQRLDAVESLGRHVAECIQASQSASLNASCASVEILCRQCDPIHSYTLFVSVVILYAHYAGFLRSNLMTTCSYMFAVLAVLQQLSFFFILEKGATNIRTNMYSVLQCTLYIVQVSIKATGQTSSAQILFCVFQIQILSTQLSSPPV